MTSINYKKITLLLLPMVLIGPLAMDMYLPAISLLQNNLSLSAISTQWTLSAFVLGFGLSQLSVGFLCNTFSPSFCLRLGIILYFISSVCLSLSNSLSGLIFFRFLQAIGACFTFVITMALVRKLSDNTQQNIKTYSILSGATAIAPIVSPILGTVLLALIPNWRIVFIFLSLYALFILLLCENLLKSIPSFSLKKEKTNRKNYLL